MAPLFLLMVLQSQDPPESSKLDPALISLEGKTSVFVRMEDQIIKKSGDFEAFCAANDDKPRSETSESTLSLLKQRAAAAWSGAADEVKKLEAAGKLGQIQKFWIVNGFACEADAEACRDLAKRPDVAYVYLQTGPAGLKQERVRRLGPAQETEASDRLKSALEKVEKLPKPPEPFSAKGLDVAWDLKQIQADKAWDLGAHGQGVIVAVNDAGAFALPALLPAFWRNPKEAVDGKDNDGNGWVDDVFGCDASRRDGFVIEASEAGHGSMCAGIIAGQPTAEQRAVTGTAPRSKVMLIKGMGYLKGMEYALENGADIFSMSYMFVNMEIGHYRGVFRLAAEHMTAAGVLLCGGAGNFATSAPEGRQITIPKDIPCVLAAAGTLEDGSRPAFSSKGPVTWEGVKFYSDYPASKPLNKPDLSAPAGGFACWNLKSELRPQWKIVFEGREDDVLTLGPQGNSFAGPHAAGAAALVLSIRPEMQPWNLKKLLESTCKDMGAPGHDIEHGAGLLQAAEAVRKAKSL